MFDFGNANDGQRQAISTTEGPVLITAGPGTGKTYTLVQRAIYLIEERGVKPEDIFIATFTEKAAKELITRITNELASRNITVNVNEMYVGTFHSLCLRIIKDHLEYTRLKKNYRLLDTFDQQYLVFRNIYKFRTISGIENVMPKGGAWKWAQAICEFSNNLTEEIVDIDASKYIKEVYGELQSVEALDLSEFTFHTVKSVNLKNTFSFTSHIAVYETCALQYKFYKELEFIFVLQATMRCLRKLTDEQLKATVFLSKENLDTLDEELRNNYNMEIKDLGQSSDKKKNSYKVRVLPPPRSIKMKRIWHEYSLIEKEYSEPIDFKVSEIDDAKYESKMYEKGSIRLELSTKETVIDDIKNQMRYSRFSLVGEISRYMNLSCVLISRILSEAIDGFDNLVEAVNKHNEVLDDVIIPKIFNTLYEVKSEQKNEDVDVILLKEPKDSGYYEFSADENLVIEKDYNSFTPEEIKKSFHADTYCFDSKPEKECFLQYISSKKVKEIYFTGMFTANQGDLFVQYYDPESKRIRQYYPDFLAKMNDGSYQLIEVKGDNMIDDEVVKAKAEAAEEMSVASGMKYVMYASSVLMKQNVLEHPPVTYSEEPSPLLMVAEDPVPYGK